jgi:hypothetical protein
MLLNIGNRRKNERRKLTEHDAKEELKRLAWIKWAHPSKLYIQRLVSDGWISQKVANRAIENLSLVPNYTTIGPGPDGMLGFTWRNGHHYFSIEFFEDGHTEQYYENIDTGKIWSDENNIAGLFTEEL